MPGFFKPCPVAISARVDELRLGLIGEPVGEVKYWILLLQRAVDIGDEVCRQVEMERFVGKEAQGGTKAARGFVEESRVERPLVRLTLELLLQQVRFIAFVAASKTPIAGVLDVRERFPDLRLDRFCFAHTQAGLTEVLTHWPTSCQWHP